jgi:dihydroorotase
MLVGGMRPHYYCLPILKRGTHRAALLEAVASGDPSFFLGTDSAPHPTHAKESACCSAGCFSAPLALPLYAMAFEEAGALDRLEAFASLNGPAFYGLPPNPETVTLMREDSAIPAPFPVGDTTVTVFDPGRPIPWRLA